MSRDEWPGRLVERGGLPLHNDQLKGGAQVPELLDIAVEAHGGLERWNEVNAVEISGLPAKVPLPRPAAVGPRRSLVNACRRWTSWSRLVGSA
jgi:hypothetical protein